MVPRHGMGRLHAQICGCDIVNVVGLVQGGEDDVVWRQADVVPVRVPLVCPVVVRGEAGGRRVIGVLDSYDVVANISALYEVSHCGIC